MGCPRSGTTLLADLFQRTPWGVPFESHFIAKYAARAQRTSKLADREQFRALVRDILAERAVRQHCRPMDPDELYNSLDRHDYPSIVAAICRTGSGNHTTWGDKTPGYLLHVALIHKMFPESRLICIVRDGRDVALSLMAKPWGQANIVSCAELWKHYHAEQPILNDLAAKKLVYHVRYEDILDRPRESAVAILEFLEIDRADELAKEWAAEVRPTNHGKWKTKMSPAGIRLFGRIAGETLRRHGYECDEIERPLAWPARAAYRLHDRAKSLRHFIHMNTIEALQIRFRHKQPFAD